MGYDPDLGAGKSEGGSVFETEIMKALVRFQVLDLQILGKINVSNMAPFSPLGGPQETRTMAQAGINRNP